MGLLASLPSPSLARTGWPWTSETNPNLYIKTNSYPKISIVTPSYNQAQFIEETIRSVLLQNYPNLEYIIIDGGSTDGTIEILKKYEPWLTYWVSEPDRGQSHALNKGIARATGEWIGWQNSDDIYLEKAFFYFLSKWKLKTKADVIFGNCYEINEYSNYIGRKYFIPFSKFVLRYHGLVIQNQSAFFKKELMLSHPLNEIYHYGLDFDFFLNIAFSPKHYNFVFTKSFLSSYRRHALAKTVNEGNRKTKEEVDVIRKQYGVQQPNIS
ncbi:MAG: glycosyltransferase, partial [Saprospiraceae bacterium]|nr:glycosyltransferase [Saprospiraceae bacterium]